MSTVIVFLNYKMRYIKRHNFIIFYEIASNEFYFIKFDHYDKNLYLNNYNFDLNNLNNNNLNKECLIL